MTPILSAEEMARYRAGALAREAARQQALAARREAAWEAARVAARLLREQFGATRVVVFGSLVHGAWYHTRSDIDLAASGISPDLFWRAGAALDRIDPRFEFDLIATENVPVPLAQALAEGVEL